MSEYILATSCCVSCHKMIQFNPDKVPSIRPYNKGAREPLCKECFDKWNEIHRTSKGLEPIPLEKDAYEPLDLGQKEF